MRRISQGRIVAHATSACAARHCGAAMVYVLILLFAISLVGGTLVRGVIAQHRQRQRDEIHAQAVRLAESGWNRALAKLSQSPDYAGEVWHLGPDALGPDRQADVRIEVAKDDAANPRKSLHIVAEYPVGSPNINRVTLSGPVTP